MKTHTAYLWMETANRRDIVHLTPLIRKEVRASGILEGLCLVSSMHLTASVIIQDNEHGLHQDIWAWLEQLAPFRSDYAHHRTGEDNADAHLKNLITHLQVVVPVTKGDLDLGPWQEIFYLEFDGQRRKRVIVKIIGL